jgi:hypothetical protein
MGVWQPPELGESIGTTKQRMQGKVTSAILRRRYWFFRLLFLFGLFSGLHSLIGLFLFGETCTLGICGRYGRQVRRSHTDFPGTIARLCSPLTVAVIGHAKCGSTTMFELITMYSGALSQMFVAPAVKEVGCLGRKPVEECMESIRGPATCNSPGLLYANLTIDAAPVSTNVKFLSRGRRPMSREIIQPAVIMLLRDPVAVIESLYNHWAEGNPEIACDSCPLSVVLSCQLKFLSVAHRKSSILHILQEHSSGRASLLALQQFHRNLGDEFRRLRCPACRGVTAENKFMFEHFYLLDVIYEFDISSHEEHMAWDNFLVVDTNALSKFPDGVRDSFFELIIGVEKYTDVKSTLSIPSWSGISKNVRNVKKPCSRLPKSLRCEAAVFLKPFSSRLFKTIQRLSDARKLTFLAATDGEWWDLHCS